MLDVASRLGVRPHPIIHRGDQKYPGGCAGEQTRRQQVIRQTVRGAADEVRRRRCDDDDASFACKSDVIQRVTRSENFCVDWTAGYCLERYRADELARPASHDDVDLSARLCKQTRQPHRLVAGDAPGDAEEYAAAGEGTRGNYSTRRRGTTRYSTSPSVSSSSARVVSFFSPGAERSRGNSLRTRAYFAATRTPRYLLVACFATSFGMKTCITSSLSIDRLRAGCPSSAPSPAHQVSRCGSA